jgi:hypothetical protein
MNTSHGCEQYDAELQSQRNCCATEIMWQGTLHRRSKGATWNIEQSNDRLGRFLCLTSTTIAFKD